MTINLTQALELVAMFGGEDTEISVAYLDNGHSGPGLYAWHTDYPDEGSQLLGEADGPPREHVQCPDCDPNNERIVCTCVEDLP